jgi:hypothetical protein
MTYAIQSGTLPPGLSLNAATGAVTGTPTTAGTYPVTIRATDEYGCYVDTDESIQICPVITLEDTLPDGVVGVSYLAEISLLPYTFAVTSGTLPPGLTLPPEGPLSGTPTTAGTYNFTITATDANGCTGSAAFEVEIDCDEDTYGPGDGTFDSTTNIVDTDSLIRLGDATSGTAVKRFSGLLPSATYNIRLTFGTDDLTLAPFNDLRIVVGDIDHTCSQQEGTDVNSTVDGTVTTDANGEFTLAATASNGDGTMLHHVHLDTMFITTCALP